MASSLPVPVQSEGVAPPDVAAFVGTCVMRTLSKTDAVDTQDERIVRRRTERQNCVAQCRRGRGSYLAPVRESR